jgi:hypothetical protein
MVAPCDTPRCDGSSAHPRHRHPIQAFNDAELACKCGATDWYLLFGGPLPALISCNTCCGTLNVQHYLSSGGGFTIDRRPVR